MVFFHWQCQTLRQVRTGSGFNRVSIYGSWFWCKVRRDLDLLDPSLTTASLFQTSSQVRLHCRCNLNLVISNVCKTALIFQFWAADGLNELPEMRFEFPLNLIAKLTMAFLTGQSWRVLKSRYTGGGLKQGFQCCFADGLNQKFSFVCGAGYSQV